MPDDHSNERETYFTKLPHWLFGLVSARAIEVYGVLGTWAKVRDVDGELITSCWPKRENIAARLFQNQKTAKPPTLRTVDRALKELEDAGAIRKIPVYGKHAGSNTGRTDNRRTSNLYEIAFEEPFLDTCVHTAATQVSTICGDTGVTTERDQEVERDQEEQDVSISNTFGESSSAATPASPHDRLLTESVKLAVPSGHRSRRVPLTPTVGLAGEAVIV